MSPYGEDLLGSLAWWVFRGIIVDARRVPVGMSKRIFAKVGIAALVAVGLALWLFFGLRSEERLRQRIFWVTYYAECGDAYYLKGEPVHQIAQRAYARARRKWKHEDPNGWKPEPSVREERDGLRVTLIYHQPKFHRFTVVLRDESSPSGGSE